MSLISLRMGLFYSRVPHDRGSAQYQETETEASKWNAARVSTTAKNMPSVELKSYG